MNWPNLPVPDWLVPLSLTFIVLRYVAQGLAGFVATIGYLSKLPNWLQQRILNYAHNLDAKKTAIVTAQNVAELKPAVEEVAAQIRSINGDGTLAEQLHDLRASLATHAEESAQRDTGLASQISTMARSQEASWAAHERDHDELQSEREAEQRAAYGYSVIVGRMLGTDALPKPPEQPA